MVMKHARNILKISYLSITSNFLKFSQDKVIIFLDKLLYFQDKT